MSASGHSSLTIALSMTLHARASQRSAVGSNAHTRPGSAGDDSNHIRRPPRMRARLRQRIRDSDLRLSKRGESRSSGSPRSRTVRSRAKQLRSVATLSANPCIVTHRRMPTPIEGNLARPRHTPVIRSLSVAGARRDVSRYLRKLEQTLIAALHEYDIEGARRDGMTGVWAGPRKSASIASAIRRWVERCMDSRSTWRQTSAASSAIVPCGDRGLPDDLDRRAWTAAGHCRGFL